MPKKILLADDSITIQKVVELTFSDGDYEVTSVSNGARAIDKLDEVRPDIILSDIMMPEKNGYELCEYVKRHPRHGGIPVILLTGTFEPFNEERAQEVGCDAVVTKPFDSQSLIRKVEELIARRSGPGAESAATAATAAIAAAPAPAAAASAPHPWEQGEPWDATAVTQPPFEEPAPSAWQGSAGVDTEMSDDLFGPPASGSSAAGPGAARLPGQPAPYDDGILAYQDSTLPGLAPPPAAPSVSSVGADDDLFGNPVDIGKKLEEYEERSRAEAPSAASHGFEPPPLPSVDDEEIFGGPPAAAAAGGVSQPEMPEFDDFSGADRTMPMPQREVAPPVAAPPAEEEAIQAATLLIGKVPAAESFTMAFSPADLAAARLGTPPPQQRQPESREDLHEQPLLPEQPSLRPSQSLQGGFGPVLMPAAVTADPFADEADDAPGANEDEPAIGNDSEEAEAALGFESAQAGGELPDEQNAAVDEDDMYEPAAAPAAGPSETFAPTASDEDELAAFRDTEAPAPLFPPSVASEQSSFAAEDEDELFDAPAGAAAATDDLFPPPSPHGTDRLFAEPEAMAMAPTPPSAEPEPEAQPEPEVSSSPAAAGLEEDREDEPQQNERDEEEDDMAMSMDSAPSSPGGSRDASPDAEPAFAAPPPQMAPASPAAGAALSDEALELVARRVVEILGDRILREIAWEVLPDMCEMVVKRRLQELESQSGA